MTIRTTLVYPALLLLFLTAPAAMAPARALTYFSEGDTVITGIVTQIDARSFSVDSGEALFDISLDDLDLDTSFAAFLAPGTRVAVRGEMDDRAFGNPVIEARKVLMVDSNLSEVQAAQMLLYDDDNADRTIFD